MPADRPTRAVVAHPELLAELEALRRHDPREHASAEHARRALAALGRDPGFPLTSAVRTPNGRGLRELRPRAGRSRHRIIYVIWDDAFVLLAVAPEARRDPRGFRRAIARATHRLAAADKGGPA